MRALTLALLAATLIPAAAWAQPIEGLYVGAAGGLSLLENQRVLSESNGSATRVLHPAVSTNFQTGYQGALNVGYAFGNGVRVEIEGNLIDNKRGTEGNSSLTISQSARETKTGAMFNALFDLDIGSPYVFPYLGAGAGYQSIARTVSKNIAGTDYAVNSSHAAMAEQAIGGLSFPIPGAVGLSVTADYRFMVVNGTQDYTGTSTSGGTTVPAGFRVRDDHTHSAMLGLRYAFNVTPPPMPASAAATAPAPAAAPAAAPAPARSYLVFFDWDKADLSARAQQIIAEAARNATRVTTTRIDVAGHADKTGAAPYNQTLSRARANAVAAELVRLGVAQSTISITAFGDTRPLVATAADVREPQNRRVEIVLK